MLVNYDPTGTGQMLNVEELEADFKNADGLKDDLQTPMVTLARNYSDIGGSKTPLGAGR